MVIASACIIKLKKTIRHERLPFKWQHWKINYFFSIFFFYYLFILDIKHGLLMKNDRRTNDIECTATHLDFNSNMVYTTELNNIVS